MAEKYYDELTKIHNETFFNEFYHTYLEEHPSSKLIMIDLRKFKSINDTYGHNVGDDYLKVFARTLSANFPNSIVARLHGDEYCIVTDMQQQAIEEAFDRCDQEIETSVATKEIPRNFGYNAGSSFATNSIEDSKEKADAMMYNGKKKEKRYQPFSLAIWVDKTDQKDFLKSVDSLLNSSSFTYKGRFLYETNGTPSDIFHISTKNSDGSSLFYDQRYATLKGDSKIIKFDVANVRKLLEEVSLLDNRVMLSIDYKTLLSADYLYDYIEFMKLSLGLEYENIILAVNTQGLDSSNYPGLINKLGILKEFGFKTCLDRYDSKIGDVLWENSDIDYIRFDNTYWKSAMQNPKTATAIRTKVNMLSEYNNGQSIFGYVENQQELDFLKQINDKILVSGHQFSKEQPLQLIKKSPKRAS